MDYVIIECSNKISPVLNSLSESLFKRSNKATLIRITEKGI